MQKAHFNCRQARRTLLVVGLALGLAACASNDGLSSGEEADLQQRLTTAESEKARAEADAEKAEAEKAAAEVEKAAAEAEKAAAEVERIMAEAARARAEAEKATAEAARAAAEAARDAAEAARDAAEAALARAEAEAERADASAEQQRQEAERQRLAAEEAERQRMILEEEAAEARREALQTEARIALMGLKGTLLSEPVVTPKYSSPASIAVSGTTFANPRGSSARPWYITTANNRGPLNEDTVVVYSDVKAPDSVPIMQQYSDFSPLDDNLNILEITIPNSGYSDLIKSSRFPTGGGRTSIIPLTIDSDDDDANDLTARLPGSFDGASGHFQCSGVGAECSVHYTGAQYNLGGDGVWTFQTSKNSKVKVPDSNFMYFGWWSQESIEDGTLSYSVFSDHGSVAASGAEFNALEGAATYTGPAIGQYAIYQTLGTQSNHGAFNATARFTADFSRNVLSGSISGFDTSPDWSLTLMEEGMDGGTVTDGDVSWTIKGNAAEEIGSWNGAFQSEIDPYAGHFPDGLTGTFDAQYGDVGKIRGAYGTHINP